MIRFDGNFVNRTRILVWTLLIIASRQIISNGAPSVSSERDDALRFMVIGDWGGVPHYPYTSLIQQNIASNMGAIAGTIGTNFTVSLGDNIYFHGVKNVEDKRFKQTFEDAFTHPSLQSPWYMIPGNHDYEGNITAQILYTKYSDRWKFPDFNYTLKFPLPTSEPTLSGVTMIMIDTVLLCGITDKSYGGEPPSGPENKELAENMWQWLEEELIKAENSTYIIICGHYPVFSIGYHGSTQCLSDRLFPLLHQYRVNAYLSGHDHNLQHLVTEQGQWLVHHFVIGAGSLVNTMQKYADTLSKKTSKFFWADSQDYGGFGYVEMNSEYLNVTLVSGKGQDLYHVSMTPRKTRSQHGIRIPEDLPIM